MSHADSDSVRSFVFDTQPVTESDHESDHESSTAVNGKVEKGAHTTTEWEIWNKKKNKWMPHDPDTYAPVPPPKEDSDNYFYIKVRRKKLSAEPFLVLAHFSKTLVRFMRTFIGDGFFGTHPTYPVEKYFPRLKDLQARHASAKAAFAMEDDTEMRESAKSLGCKNATEDEPIDNVKQYLKDLVEHADVLVEYLDQEFKPTADKLRLMTSYGHMEFNMLIHYFQAGDEVSLHTEMRPLSFVVSEQSYEYMANGRVFCITGEGLYWDGEAYASQRRTAIIEEFEGTREVVNLAVRHLSVELKEELRARGELYTTLSGSHYRIYDNDRVMIDRQAYTHKGGYDKDPKSKAPKLASKDLHKLPYTVFGFNITKKHWSEMDIFHISEVVFDEQAWAHLVLEDNTKTLLRALTKATCNNNTSTKILSDVISGKGGGLITLLHGPPGTGKTLTAEAIAEHLKRPLYTVGASDLTTNPYDMEQKLKRILKLATAWDAILLIDEADVFLEQRTPNDLERNSLVSVALRVLEYHRGVLFLTTNRVTAFDEAFLSRFSIAIKYPNLEKAGRYAVWCKFFELAGCKPVTTGSNGRISYQEVDELAEKSFNGRTIKNLVRTAQALAMSLNESLTVEHVNVVVRVQEMFIRDFGQEQGKCDTATTRTSDQLPEPGLNQSWAATFAAAARRLASSCRLR